MIFDYMSLRRAELEGEKLGNWNGGPVFAASAAKLHNKGNGAYYIIYDDDNAIVRKLGSGWKSYGYVTESGSVKEYSTPRTYKVAEPEVSKSRATAYYEHEDYTDTYHAPRPQSSTSSPSYSSTSGSGTGGVGTGGTYTPGYEVDEKVSGDARMEVEVENTLKKARETSVDDLLAGFHYGMDDFCVHNKKAKG